MTVERVIVVAELMIILTLVAMLVVRQVRGQYMDRRRLWRVPLVVGAIGLVYLPFTAPAIVPADALLVALGLLVSTAVGLGLAALTTIDAPADADRRGRRLVIRSGWRGGALWVAFIAARLALQPLASALDARLVVSPGMVLILIAVARAAMAVIVSPRLDAVTAKLAPLPARRSSHS